MALILDILKRWPKNSKRIGFGSLGYLSEIDAMYMFCYSVMLIYDRIGHLFDEIHNVFSENARNTINNLNPDMVLGLTTAFKL